VELWRYGTMSISRSFSFPTPNNRLLAERSAGALPIIFNILACSIHLTLGWLCSEHTATPARGPPHSHPTLPTLNSTCCHHTNAYLEAPAPSHLSTIVAGRACRQEVQDGGILDISALIVVLLMPCIVWLWLKILVRRPASGEEGTTGGQL